MQTNTIFDFSGDRITPTPMREFHRHSEMELNFVTSGHLTYVVGGYTVTIRPGQWCLFWGAIPHQTVSFSGCDRKFWYTLPMGTFMQWNLPEDLVNGLLRGQVALGPKPKHPQSEADQAQQWLLDIQSQDPQKKELVLLEMEAKLKRLAGTFDRLDQGAPLQSSAQPLRRPHRPGKVEQMTRFIIGHYTQALSVSEISGAAGLHPNYAMKLFKKNCGMSMVAYVNRMRVSHAQQLLVKTNRTVLDIALDSGFGSTPRFYTAFKDICGVTPKTYRKRTKA